MQFRAMRRSAQQYSKEETEAIYSKCSTGVLAVNGEGGYPYAVPVNFVYHGGKIYFHCAPEGHKLDALKANPKVCFTAVAADDILEATYSTRYESAIAFGTAAIVTDDMERREAFLALTKKYAPSRPAKEIADKIGHCEKALIIGVTIEHMTGKRGKYDE